MIETGERVLARRPPGLLLRLLLPTLLTGLAAHAYAQAPGADDPAMAAAKADFEEAQTLYIKENWDGAAAKFISAYERKPFPAFLFNAAAAYEKAKRLELAIDYYQRYLDRAPDAKDARDVGLRIEGLRRILAAERTPAQAGQPPSEPISVAMLPAIETKGLVVIDSRPQGAMIYLNDKNTPLGSTRWEGSLEPRPVTILLEARGFKPEKRTINPRPDKVLEVYIAMSEEHFLGWVEIASNVAGADVYIDRKEIGAIGKTPFTGHVKPGKHRVWVEKAGYNTVEREIDVQPGEATNHQFDLERVAAGWIAVRGKQTRGGRLTVDGQFACETPCQHTVPVGRHRVVVSQEGMEDYEAEVNVQQATQTTIDIVWSPKPPKTRAWTTAVISAVFLGGGIYLGLQANKLEDGLRADIASGTVLVDSGDDRVQKGKLYAIGADVAFGLAAITGIVSLVNFVSSGPPSKGELDDKLIGLAPIPIAGGAGLGAAGRF